MIDRVWKLLGQGTFGRVVKAWDVDGRRMVAIKIIRAVPKYRDAAKLEVRVLQTLQQHDPDNKRWVKCCSILLLRTNFSH